jgi:hypothetical protein
MHMKCIPFAFVVVVYSSVCCVYTTYSSVCVQHTYDSHAMYHQDKDLKLYHQYGGLPREVGRGERTDLFALLCVDPLATCLCLFHHTVTVRAMASSYMVCKAALLQSNVQP